MKKAAKVILIATLILSLSLTIFTGCGKKGGNNDDNSTDVIGKDTAEEVKITYSGIADGLFTQDGTDYYASEEGFFTQTKDGVNQLSNLKCTGNFTIIDNVIYYAVIDHTGEPVVKSTSETGKISHEWIYCSLYKMNLDGSNNEKVFDCPSGDIDLIYIDSNAIFYLSDDITDDVTVYSSLKGYQALYRYDIKTQKDELLQEYVCPDVKFLDGKIFFSIGHSSMNLLVCDTKDASVTHVDEAEGNFLDCLAILDKTHILFCVHNEKAAQYIYNTADNSVSEFVNSFGFNLDENPHYSNTNIDGLLSITVNDDDKTTLYSYRYGKEPVKVFESEGNTFGLISKFIDDTTVITSSLDGADVFIVKNGEKSAYKNLQSDGHNIIYLGEYVYASYGDYDANFVKYNIKSYN